MTNLSKLSGINIVLDEGVFPEGEEVIKGEISPRVTTQLKDLPLGEVLTVILRPMNLVWRIEGNEKEGFIWITSPEIMSKEGSEWEGGF